MQRPEVTKNRLIRTSIRRASRPAGRLAGATPASKRGSSEDRIADQMETILASLGEDPAREGLARTPIRYARAMKFLTSGYSADVTKIVNGAIFHEDTEDMVVVRDIELFSLCEHHLLPFFGRAHVAYLPRGKVIGLSKIPRLVNVYARRLQLQERLTRQVGQELMKLLDARGVAVVIEAHHMCMMMRGVEKQQSFTVTRSMLGEFRTHAEHRNEFYQLLRGTRASGRLDSGSLEL